MNFNDLDIDILAPLHQVGNEKPSDQGWEQKDKE